MASSAPLATANPPLSYAERAKRAQNARPQQTPQRPVAQSTSLIAPTAAAPSSARSAPVNPPPAISKSSSSGSTGSDARTSSTATHGPPPSSSKPAFPPSTDSSDTKPNGDVNHHGDSSASVPSASKATAPPPNVWTMRKEQMAARVLNQPRTSQPSNQASASGLQSPPTSLESTASSTSTSTSVPANPINPSPSTAPPVTNGHRVPPAANDDDPFIVKPGRSPSSLKPSLPAIDDAESWPEVGQVVTTPPNGKKEGREEEEKGHEREPSQGHGTKKSEKTKWVPVPPEELQFEGPARAQHTRQRSQNPDRNGNRQSLGPSGAGSSSGQGSQQQSRTHSAAGRRPTPSHAGSVSHSQAQSRTGSVQSSPRHPSIRGGARRLPDDVNTLPVANRSIRSSTTNSPLTYAQPQPLPAQEFIPAVRPYVNTSVSQSGRDPSALGVIPDSSAAELNPHAYYHPQPTHLGVSPYHSPRPAGSPVSNPPYLMPPPMPYAGQPAMPQPIPGYGTPPPYPMYAAYGYPYGQPYVYWPPPGVPLPPMSSSPVTNAQLAEGVPPPSMLARPPPPNESDAVAGYRDVGFVLPPPVEHIQHEQGEERGRRTRELSFGSISAGLGGTSKSPSPTPRSPGLGDVLEGAALGLDVSGGQLSAQANSQSGRPTAEGDITESKSFTLFSIGLSPGEPGPARLRSRTRTQSKGLATSVSGQDEAQEKESEQAASSREEPVVALTEIVAKVIDLTDPETKWEFGTTKVADGTAEPTEPPPESIVPPSNDAPVFVEPASSVPPPIPGTNFVPLVTPYASPPLFLPPVAIPQPLHGLPSAPSPSAYAPRQPGGEDEWEVRDYGFGFGRGAGPNSYSSHPSQSAVSPRDDRPPFRERREFPPHNEREQQYGRPRRGSYGQGGYGYERGGERGSYAGRRGRGLSGGYGGRGYRDRSYSGRGGYAGRGQQTYVPQSQHQSEVNGYYGPASTLTTYIPQPGFDYSYPSYPPPPPQPHLPGAQGAPPPPMPMPQTALHFPLDTTRYYLLGQLEYYLSAQNLATDFFLRQQMDSRGWIPISLIASFNRVRNLTGDPQLVTDVLTLSSLVEVKGSHVRMRSWQQFILPTALPSRVEEDEQPQEHTAAIESQQYDSHPHEEQYASHQNHEGEEEEEEEVEFVL